MEMLGYPCNISSQQACGNAGVPLQYRLPEGMWKCWGTPAESALHRHVEMFCCSLRVGRAHGPDLCSQLMCRIGCCLATAVFPGADGSRSTPVSDSRKEGSETVRESSPNTLLGKALGGC